jgi:hypothetical protein
VSRPDKYNNSRDQQDKGPDRFVDESGAVVRRSYAQDRRKAHEAVARGRSPQDPPGLIFFKIPAAQWWRSEFDAEWMNNLRTCCRFDA